MPKPIELNQSQMSRDAEQLWAKMRTPLGESHPLRSEKPKDILDEKGLGPVLTYGDAVRAFDFFIKARHAEFRTQNGVESTHPYGPTGISADGLFISFIRNPWREVVMYLRNLERGGMIAVTNPEARMHQDFSVRTGNRIAFRARALGEFTLQPSVDESLLKIVDVSRQVDYSESIYRAAYPDALIVPIGALSGGTSAPVPIFPIDAFLKQIEVPTE